METSQGANQSERNISSLADLISEYRDRGLQIYDGVEHIPLAEKQRLEAEAVEKAKKMNKSKASLSTIESTRSTEAVSRNLDAEENIKQRLRARNKRRRIIAADKLLKRWQEHAQATSSIDKQDEKKTKTNVDQSLAVTQGPTVKQLVQIFTETSTDGIKGDNSIPVRTNGLMPSSNGTIDSFQLKKAYLEFAARHQDNVRQNSNSGKFQPKPLTLITLECLQKLLTLPAIASPKKPAKPSTKKAHNDKGGNKIADETKADDDQPPLKKEEPGQNEYKMPQSKSNEEKNTHVEKDTIQHKKDTLPVNKEKKSGKDSKMNGDKINQPENKETRTRADKSHQKIRRAELKEKTIIAEMFSPRDVYAKKTNTNKNKHKNKQKSSKDNMTTTTETTDDGEVECIKVQDGQFTLVLYRKKSYLDGKEIQRTSTPIVAGRVRKSPSPKQDGVTSRTVSSTRHNQLPTNKAISYEDADIKTSPETNSCKQEINNSHVDDSKKQSGNKTLEQVDCDSNGKAELLTEGGGRMAGQESLDTGRGESSCSTDRQLNTDAQTVGIQQSEATHDLQVSDGRPVSRKSEIQPIKREASSNSKHSVDDNRDADNEITLNDGDTCSETDRIITEVTIVNRKEHAVVSENVNGPDNRVDNSEMMDVGKNTEDNTSNNRKKTDTHEQTETDTETQNMSGDNQVPSTSGEQGKKRRRSHRSTPSIASDMRSQKVPNEESMTVMLAKLRHGYKEEQKVQSEYLEQIEGIRSQLRTEYKKFVLHEPLEDEEPEPEPEIEEKAGEVKEEKKPKKKPVVSKLDTHWDKANPIYTMIKTGFKTRNPMPRSKSVESEIKKMRNEHFQKSKDLNQSNVYLIEAKRIYSQGFESGESGKTTPSTKSEKAQTPRSTSRENNVKAKSKKVSNSKDTDKENETNHGEPESPKRKPIFKPKRTVTEQQKEQIPARNPRPKVCYPKIKKRSKSADSMDEKLAKDTMTAATYQQYVDNRIELPKIRQRQQESSRHTNGRTSVMPTDSKRASKIRLKREYSSDNGDDSFRQRTTNNSPGTSRTNTDLSSSRRSEDVGMQKAVDIVQSRKSFFNGSDIDMARGHRVLKIYNELKLMRKGRDGSDVSFAGSISEPLHLEETSGFLLLNSDTRIDDFSGHKSSRELDRFMCDTFKYQLCVSGSDLYQNKRRKARALDIVRDKVNRKGHIDKS